MVGEEAMVVVATGASGWAAALAEKG